MKKMIVMLALMVPMFILGMTSAQAQGRWEFLGKRAVDYGLDRDVIPVTWRDGAFDGLKFEVKGGALNMRKCIVHFENGGKQEIELRHNFGKGSDSRIVDLRGNNRLVEKIELWYDTKNIARNKAVILVYGRH
jgi:hypothetical protein